MSIPEIRPTNVAMIEITEQSKVFYKEIIKGKKLHVLKIWLDAVKRDFYQSLDRFFEKRKISVGPPKINELIHTLRLIKDLKSICSEMCIQEKRLIIRAIRKIGANPKVSASAFLVTILLTAYTAIAFGIYPDFDGNATGKILVISGIIAVVLFVILTLFFESLQHSYDKIKIGKYDLMEREFFSRYFKHFGKLEFDMCVDLIDNMDEHLKLEVEFKWRNQLMDLARDCQEYQSHLYQELVYINSQPLNSLNIPAMGLDLPGNSSISLQELTGKLQQQIFNQSSPNLHASGISFPSGPSQHSGVPILQGIPSQCSQFFEPFDYESSDDEEEGISKAPSSRDIGIQEEAEKEEELSEII